LAVELEAPLLEQGAGALRGLSSQAELRLHHAGLRALADDVLIRTAADHERQGLDGERLPGARLPRDRREAAAELHLGALDEGEVADGQAFEHGVIPLGTINLA